MSSGPDNYGNRYESSDTPKELKDIIVTDENLQKFFDGDINSLFEPKDRTKLIITRDLQPVVDNINKNHKMNLTLKQYKDGIDGPDSPLGKNTKGEKGALNRGEGNVKYYIVLQTFENNVIQKKVLISINLDYGSKISQLAIDGLVYYGISKIPTNDKSKNSEILKQITKNLLNKI